MVGGGGIMVMVIRLHQICLNMNSGWDICFFSVCRGYDGLGGVLFRCDIRNVFFLCCFGC